MSVLNENMNIKIKDVTMMSWDISDVKVSERPYHALVFRKSGSACFLHDKLKLNTTASNVFYMPANYEYKATYPERNEILVIHFESDLIAKMENFTLNNPDFISLLFHKLYDIWINKEIGYYFAALSVMCEILKSISESQAFVSSNETIKSFEKAVEYMENNYTNCAFSVKDMVLKAHMSNTYFCKLFCNKFNITPVRYLTQKRLMTAEKLLSTGKYSIKEVSEMSGFGDVKYFSRVIKKEYGVPPSKLFCHLTK